MAYTIGIFTTLSVLFIVLHRHQVQYRQLRVQMAAISGRMIDDAKAWHVTLTETLRKRIEAQQVNWRSFLMAVVSLFLGGGILGYSLAHSVAVGITVGGLLSIGLPFRKLRKVESAFDYAHCVSLFDDVIPKGVAAMDLDENLESAFRDIAKNGESATGRRMMGRANQWHRAKVNPGEHFLTIAEEEGHAEWMALAAISAAVENQHPNMSKIWEHAGRMMQEEWKSREDFYEHFRGYRTSANVVFGIILGVVFVIQIATHLLGGKANDSLTTFILFGAVVLYLVARYVLDLGRMED